VELRVSKECKGVRLDQALVQMCQGFSRAQVQRMIDRNLVTVNGRIEKKRYLVCEDDEIVFSVPVVEPLCATPEPMNFDVIYEDSDLFVINKQPGLVVHPAPGNRSGTFVNGFVAYCQDLECDDPVRPGIVHRLDQDTSGVLIAAKNQTALHALSQQFQDRSVHKEYLAVVHGQMSEEQEIDSPIGRNPRERKKMAVVDGGKIARTRCAPLKRIGDYTFVRVLLYTGRTHQIRVHLAHVGFPVVGDQVYGRRKTECRQMLHSYRIECKHPRTGAKMEFVAPLHADMEKMIG